MGVRLKRRCALLSDPMTIPGSTPQDQAQQQPQQPQAMKFDPEAEPSEEIRGLQQMMEAAGYYVEATGVFDEQTKKAVKNLARDMGDEQSQGDTITPEMVQYIQQMAEKEVGPKPPGGGGGVQRAPGPPGAMA